MGRIRVRPGPRLPNRSADVPQSAPLPSFRQKTPSSACDIADPRGVVQFSQHRGHAETCPLSNHRCPAALRRPPWSWPFSPGHLAFCNRPVTAGHDCPTRSGTRQGGKLPSCPSAALAPEHPPSGEASRRWIAEVFNNNDNYADRVSEVSFIDCRRSRRKPPKGGGNHDVDDD